MIPEVGQRFGPYEILGRLGGGGMGLVFRAWDERLHREVAIKLLHDDYTMPGMRERFLQEARAASALNHPNICTVFDIGEQDHNPYLVMELLEGETVKDRIAHGALSAEDIRSDLFSLGIVLYEMATRQVPFRGTTSALVFVQLFSHDPEPVRNWNESIPRDLEKVILKLLAKQRKARFQTAQELRDALVKVGKKLG